MTTNNSKPTVITAADFVRDGYAAKIAAGECVVEYKDKSGAINEVSIDSRDGSYLATATPNPVMVAEGTVDPGVQIGFLDYEGLYEFAVTWLPEQPEPAKPEAVAGESSILTDKALFDAVKEIQGNEVAGRLIVAIKYVRSKYPIGLGAAKDYVESVFNHGAFPVKLQVEMLQDELAAFRAALALATAENKRLRTAIEAALEKYAPSHKPSMSTSLNSNDYSRQYGAFQLANEIRAVLLYAGGYTAKPVADEEAGA